MARHSTYAGSCVRTLKIAGKKTCTHGEVTACTDKLLLPAAPAASAAAAARPAGEGAVVEKAGHGSALAEPKQSVERPLLVPHLPQKRQTLLDTLQGRE